MKSSFIEEKISELQRLDRQVKADISDIRKLIAKRKQVKTTTTVKPASKKSVVTSLKSAYTPKKPAAKKQQELQFYDVKARKRFSSKNYREVVKNKTLFAVAKSPYGNYECYRILKKV